MRAALLADAANTHAVANASLTAVCNAIAGAVVAHIQAEGVVNVTVATTGTAAAQAGTGVGTVT